jgi:hypothetical protein
VDQLIRTHPAKAPVDESMLAEAVDRIYECAKACAACANACLGEDDPTSQAACITSCENCGEVCITTARALSRITGFNAEAIRHLVAACEQICRICGDECASHATEMEHCQVCAECCRTCAEACRSLLQELQAA